MIEDAIKKANKLNEKVGVPKIPVPSKRAMKVGNTVNKIAGMSLITYGVLASQKWATALGATSIILNGIITKKRK